MTTKGTSDLDMCLFKLPQEMMSLNIFRDINNEIHQSVGAFHILIELLIVEGPLH